MRVVGWPFLGRMIGCLTFSLMSALLILPSTLNVPLGCRNESNLHIPFDFFITAFFTLANFLSLQLAFAWISCKTSISFEKALFCIPAWLLLFLRFAILPRWLVKLDAFLQYSSRCLLVIYEQEPCISGSGFSDLCFEPPSVRIFSSERLLSWLVSRWENVPISSACRSLDLMLCGQWFS